MGVSPRRRFYACRKEITPEAEAPGVIASYQLLSFHCYYFNSRRRFGDGDIPHKRGEHDSY